MSINNSQFFEAYVPVYDTVPEDWESARQFLVEHLKKISNAVNIRSIGWMLDEELLAGQQFIPGIANNQAYRSILRKVIDFGSLPNAAIKSVAHGIIVDERFTLMHMYLSATDPINFLGFSLQYWSKDATNDIKLNYDDTNVNVETLSDYRDYTRSFVVIEYIQEL